MQLRGRTIFAASLALALLLTASAVGQETRATLSGTITDPSGAAVAGAKLHLVNVDTGVDFTADSNMAGQYRFMFLNPGIYRLSAEMSGFRTFVREKIALSVGQAATVDVALQLGTQADTVTVGGEAPLIEAEKGDRGMLVDQRQLTELPMNSRNPILLVTLVPGVSQTEIRYDLVPFSNSGLSNWSINGSAARTTSFMVDGAPNDMISGNQALIAYVPPVDAVQEFKVNTGPYDAQYGRNGGGVINAMLKSGTNSFHGSVYEFLKRPRLNANLFSNNAKGLGRDSNLLDQYGFTIGGPVRIPKVYNGRDRTFFFVAWEGFRQNILFPANDTSSVPTVAQRNGDFSKTFNNLGQLMPIYDPQTGRMDATNRWVRDLFPDNKIPGNRINPVAAKIASLYPEPNLLTPGSPDWQNNFFLKDNIVWYHFKNFVTRVDHNFSEKQRVYARYAWNDQLMWQVSNGMPTYPAADQRYGHKINNAGVFDSITVLGPTATLDLRVSVSRWLQDYKPRDWGTVDASLIGWPKSLTDRFPDAQRFPYFSPANYRPLGSGSGNIQLFITTTLAFQPVITVMRGRHSLKTGIDMRRTGYATYPAGYTAGQLGFDRGFTRRDYLTQDTLSGNSIASMLLGYGASGQVDSMVRPYYSWMYYAPYVQDDIKLTRKLTVNLGLRWDYTKPVTERYDRMNRDFLAGQVNPISSQIDQTKFPGYKVNGGIGFAGKDGLARSPFNPDKNNFQPRVGAAFQLRPTLVMRGGYGLSFINQVSQGNLLGFSLSTPFVSTLDAGRTPESLISNPFPSGILQPAGAAGGMKTMLGQGPLFSDTAGLTGYAHVFSFGFQKQLPGQIALDVSYVGSRTIMVATSRGFNEISLQNLALGDTSKGGNPNYLNAAVPNPFQNLMPGTSLNNATVTRQQLLRPYPQFTSFNIQDVSDGKIWYNSLQVSVQKRYSHGLSVTVSYTLSKNIEALTYLNAQDIAPTRNLVAWDRPQRMTVAPIYELPFGPGKPFLTSNQGVVSRLVGGWQMVMNTMFQSGLPMATAGNVYLLGDPRLANPTWDRMFKTGVVDADGTVRNVASGESPVYQIRPPFTLRATPLYYGNLRNLWGREYSVSFVKNTRVREGMNAQFRAEVFNIFNTPIFAMTPNTDPTSTNLGKILRDNGQSNMPRQIQLALRFTF
jgi:hypothetical protein